MGKASIESVPPRSAPVEPSQRSPLAYVEAGTGPSLLLIHGSLSDYRWWAPQLQGLAGRYRVVAPSLRHHWPERWDGNGDDYSIATHVRDLGTLLDAVGGQSAVVLGHSYGGRVALELALQLPHRVRALILADPIADLGPVIDRATLAGTSAPRDAAVDRFRQGDVEGGLQLYVDHISGGSVWQRLSEARRQAMRDNAWTLAGQMREAVHVLSQSGAQRLSAPTLLLNGERSRDFYKHVAMTLGRVLPNARHATIGGSGHAMNLENPQAFNRAIAEFAGVSADPSATRARSSSG